VVIKQNLQINALDIPSYLIGSQHLHDEKQEQNICVYLYELQADRKQISHSYYVGARRRSRGLIDGQKPDY